MGRVARPRPKGGIPCIRQRSWRYVPAIGSKLQDAYRWAALDTNRGRADVGPARDQWVGALGQHLLPADLWGPEAARTEDWLGAWYAHADEPARHPLTRLIAEFAGQNPNAPVRARARAWLRWRIAALSGSPRDRELRSVSWVSASTEEPAVVLADIVLAALRAAHGAADDGYGRGALGR